MRKYVDDPRVRRAFNWIAAGLFAYWLIDKLWPAPFGTMLKGAALGGLYALIALGIALIYRANRIINFAQGDIGGVPAALAVLLIAVAHWPYPLGVLVGLASGILLG